MTALSTALSFYLPFFANKGKSPLFWLYLSQQFIYFYGGETCTQPCKKYKGNAGTHLAQPAFMP